MPVIITFSDWNGLPLRENRISTNSQASDLHRETLDPSESSVKSLWSGTNHQLWNVSSIYHRREKNTCPVYIWWFKRFLGAKSSSTYEALLDGETIVSHRQITSPIIILHSWLHAFQELWTWHYLATLAGYLVWLCICMSHPQVTLLVHSFILDIYIQRPLLSGQCLLIDECLFVVTFNII